MKLSDALILACKKYRYTYKLSQKDGLPILIWCQRKRKGGETR